MRTSVDVTPFEIPLEFPRDRLSTGFGEFGRVASLLQLPDVIGDFLIVLGELVEVGKVINQVMPCTGTDGELDPMDAADVNLADEITVEGASARQKGKQTTRKAVGMEASSVAELDLGGQLVVEAIKSKVKVKRMANGKLKRNAKASFGAITLGGEPQSLDQLGELEIPGLAKIQTGLTKRIKGGIRIVGVRVTLLDGTGAVLDFATSKLSISES